MENSEINVYGATFDDCYAELDASFGTTILLTSKSKGVFNATQFTNNFSLQGGAIYAKDGSQLSIYDSDFIGNEVQKQGGALMVEA